MDRRVPTWALSVGRDVRTVTRRAQVPLLAASIAYFVFTSAVPLALLFVITMTAVGGEAFADRLLRWTAATVDEPFVDPLVEAVLDVPHRRTSTVIGVAVLVWSSLRLFRGIDGAFAAIYAERSNRTLWSAFRDAGVVLVTSFGALGLLASVGVGLGVNLEGSLRSVAAPIALFVALAVVFVPMFYVFPRADVTVVEILPGATFAAGAWAVSSVGFRLYATSAGAHPYGVAGAVVLALTWLYLGGLTLLFGAALNAVLGGRVDLDDE